MLVGSVGRAKTRYSNIVILELNSAARKMFISSEVCTKIIGTESPFRLRANVVFGYRANLGNNHWPPVLLI